MVKFFPQAEARLIEIWDYTLDVSQAVIEEMRLRAATAPRQRAYRKSRAAG